MAFTAPRMSANSASSTPGAPPLPRSVSSLRLRRALLRLGACIAVAVVVITLVPGLGELRSRFAHAQPAWIVVACGFELLSVFAYVPAFRVVFCTRMSWRTSVTIAVAEEGAGSLFPIGGTGSLALGVWALRRGGMPAGEIARKTVAFFLLTSLPSVVSLLVVGVGLATGVLPGGGGIVLTVVPALVAATAIAGTLVLGRYARRLEPRVRQSDSRWARLAPGLLALADGIDEAVRLLQQRNLLLLLGLAGYLAFDILVLWASFRAVGFAPPLTIVWIAYLIGQLGNWIPIPGGIGGVDIGLIAMLVVYGLPAVTATAAVLLYRVIELWIPAMFGIVAFIELRRLLRHEAEAIDLCRPGEAVEIIGFGSVIPEPVLQR